MPSNRQPNPHPSAPRLRCFFTVRFEWDVDAGHAHPPVTWGCVASRQQAAACVSEILIRPIRGVRLIGVSTRAGKFAHWVPVYYAPVQGEHSNANAPKIQRADATAGCV